MRLIALRPVNLYKETCHDRATCQLKNNEMKYEIMNIIAEVN